MIDSPYALDEVTERRLRAVSLLSRSKRIRDTEPEEAEKLRAEAMELVKPTAPQPV
jgi:hypothetical protein